MNIGTHVLGDDVPYVIAEIGSNHNNDLATAIDLIEMASEAGAAAAKFQLYRDFTLYPGTLTPGAIPDWWLPELKWVCDDLGVDFICSVFCQETLDAYLAIDPVAIKIASPESTGPLVNAALETKLPLLIATGATTWADLDALPDLHDNVCLLHCVSAYPTPPTEMNLAVIPAIRDRYDVEVGLSDHTLDPTTAAVAAVALGATVIEKHVTFDRQQDGPDHSFAIEPAELDQLVNAVRQAWWMIGSPDKHVTASEDPTDRRPT